MRISATVVALLALVAARGFAAEEGKGDSPAARRGRIEALDREFAKSCALVRTWLRTDEDGEPLNNGDGSLQGDDTRYSFGAFPYLGEITAAIIVTAICCPLLVSLLHRFCSTQGRKG